MDRRLRDTVPYIEDDGFTALVLRQLPRPQRSGQFLRPLILVGMSAFASALTYVLSDGGRFVVVEMFKLTTIPTLWVVVFALARRIADTATALHPGLRVEGQAGVAGMV